MIAALTSDTDPGRSLHTLYSEHATPTSTQATHAAALIEQAGTRARSESTADQWAHHARSALDRAQPHHRADLDIHANAAIRRGH
ncbi:hypothetical protein EAO75_44015 [Streptomyces sp. uw30]|uniref:hypothetical protein n=1 Tax=Streptomyces sp. uw30 TaxID=1828179 RepID=UPI0011CD7C90|nr:hypothetical protein [Streptomyces sp. uw30]TXS35573.1 hypothetical protein EAO75_44015 [Streptomyces sp. uw30]